MMKNLGNLYPKNSPQAELNRKKTTLLDQGWNEPDQDYMGRLKKMLQDSQRYIDKLHKTVYDKNRKLDDMQNHIYFLEDELYHIQNGGLPPQEGENYEQETSQKTDQNEETQEHLTY
ncbi:hypothetical protein [Flammeovirga agarivorans]|uniref:Uncharacterized protein n=1 Tax=Flammeovirga agarivorans TaxID=2726742 RepID=A0A7X8XTZ3_9BACT|nr:hypothetical protein [Flammeovirga agarivorans]NLR89600.1 hypothetical protein [Flammeovirga agarivorans]